MQRKKVGKAGTVKKKKSNWVLSDDGRERIAKAQRKRWDKFHKEQRVKAKAVATKKRAA